MNMPELSTCLCHCRARLGVTCNIEVFALMQSAQVHQARVCTLPAVCQHFPSNLTWHMQGQKSQHLQRHGGIVT